MEKNNYRIPAMSVATVTSDDAEGYGIWWIKPGVQDVLNVENTVDVITLGPYVHDAYIRVEGAATFAIVGSASPIVPIALSDYIGGGGGVSDPLLLNEGLSISGATAEDISVAMQAYQIEFSDISGPLANFREWSLTFYTNENEVSQFSTDGMFVKKPDNSNVIEVDVSGANVYFNITGLPTADPLNAGDVWNDAGTLKISTGA